MNIYTIYIFRLKIKSYILQYFIVGLYTKWLRIILNLIMFFPFFMKVFITIVSIGLIMLILGFLTKGSISVILGVGGFFIIIVAAVFYTKDELKSQ